MQNKNRLKLRVGDLYNSPLVTLDMPSADTVKLQGWAGDELWVAFKQTGFFKLEGALNLLEILLKCKSLGPTPGFSDSSDLGYGPENLYFLTKIQVILMQLAQGLEFENCCCRQL